MDSFYETEELTTNTVRDSPRNDCHKSQLREWKMQSLITRDGPTVLHDGARHIRKTGLSSRHTLEPYIGGQPKQVGELGEETECILTSKRKNYREI